MTNILLKSQKKAPDNILEILRIVFDVSAELKIQTFIIGAIARDLIFENVYNAEIRRATEDIDFGVAVESWEKYESLKKALAETGRLRIDKKIEQRMWWNIRDEEMKIDLVPFGGLESKEGEIAFPPDGDFVMNITGFAEVYENAIHLELTNDLTVKIASLAGLAVLKFIAFNDRPSERKRDVQDIWFIARNYMIADNEDRLYDPEQDADLVTNDDFDFATCGARLLGRDMAVMLNDETKAIVLKLLSEENEGGKLGNFADIIFSDGLRDEDEYEKILTTFRELRKGITESTQ